MMIEVRGIRKTWLFHFYAEPQFLKEWRADGLEVNVMENTVPMILPRFVPVRAWVFLQDIFNFRNPWRK